ncbi:hypothetical protein VHEMI08050 [[Torrubiella] hemipterigena]|uniref:AB hydrolase-1 domain-containing protein n=1 Tax=[Torrubiella] hemipterigena TaxID=1531966 RepID=A0A0A1TMG9_9HYPO|nr:hypothetical protein VHEMI08050 [[Torrubiella] hemipterigena]
MKSVQTLDHDGEPAYHGRARVNGIRMHYLVCPNPANNTQETTKPAIVLLHGTPKNSFYWHRLVPYLTQRFTVVAPDLRGFGYTDKPPTSDGYDCLTNAHDVAELMEQLGFKQYYVHGEDRGAEYAFSLAATYRDRVIKLSFCEMLLTGFGLEESNVWSESNVTAQMRMQGVWCWHLSFFWIPHVPEMLITGKEREFWEHFMRAECFDPTAIQQLELDHWTECSKQPGALRGILETYRSAFVNAKVNKESVSSEKGGKITCPVMTIGAPEFFGPTVRNCMLHVATNVEFSEIYQECGHSLALEKPERLAGDLIKFMLD